VEDCALANFAVHGQAAAHQLGEALDDGQPNAGPFPFRRWPGFRLNKRFETSSQFPSRDPDAGVLDVNQQRPAAAVSLALPGDARLNPAPLVNLMALLSKFTTLGQPQAIQQQCARQVA